MGGYIDKTDIMIATLRASIIANKALATSFRRYVLHTDLNQQAECLEHANKKIEAEIKKLQK